MALTNLGDLYYFGEHIKQDYDKALNFYQKAEKKYYYNYDKISEIYYQLSDYKNLLDYLKKTMISLIPAFIMVFSMNNVWA
jgi:TPR repeat protein